MLYDYTEFLYSEPYPWSETHQYAGYNRSVMQKIFRPLLILDPWMAGSVQTTTPGISYGDIRVKGWVSCQSKFEPPTKCTRYRSWCPHEVCMPREEIPKRHSMESCRSWMTSVKHKKPLPRWCWTRIVHLRKLEICQNWDQAIISSSAWSSCTRIQTSAEEQAAKTSPEPLLMGVDKSPWLITNLLWTKMTHLLNLRVREASSGWMLTLMSVMPKKKRPIHLVIN